jgi:thiol-disulfide isomerase/thioredoxin
MPRAFAADDDNASPIAHGVLAGNSLAKAFEPSPHQLPDIYVTGPDGDRRLSDFKGKTILMPLWTEWCAPCIQEIPDFARLQQKYGNDKFAIVPVLTATQKKFTPELLSRILGMMHAGVFTPWIEQHRGATLMRRMARRRGGGAAMPCNLLIAPDGRVVAREIGGLSNTDDADPAKSYKDAVNRTGTGSSQSRWGQQDGEDFAKAMADGFLA